MKLFLILVTLVSASSALAYKPCRPPAYGKPAVSLSCSPYDVKNWPKVLTSFVLANVACDNKTGTKTPNLSQLKIAGGGYGELASDVDISKLPIPVGGRPEARLISNVNYVRASETDRLELQMGPRSDGTESSTIYVTADIDKTSSFRRTNISLNDVSHWATLTFTRILPDGSRQTSTESGYACSVHNEGVKGVRLDGEGWMIDFE